MSQTIKCIVLGTSGCGKTSLCDKMSTGKFNNDHNSTVENEIINIQFTTSKNSLLKIFAMYDGDYSTNLIKNVDCGIIMFDKTEPHSFHMVEHYVNSFKQLCPDKPFVVCGNKSDSKEVKVHIDNFITHSLGYKCIPISCKSNFQINKPFGYLLIQLGLDR